LKLLNHSALVGAASLLAGSLALVGPAQAQLTGLVAEDGFISLSVDGVGTNDPAGTTIQVNKPSAGATVRSAYLAAASTFTNPILPGQITLNGVEVGFTESVFNGIGGNPMFFNNVFGDVTAIVAPLIDAAPAGIINIPVMEAAFATDDIEGEILAVIFDDPSVTEPSGVILLFGGQAPQGEQFTVSLAEPLDLTDPNAKATMGLGISFGFQDTVGTNMISEVDVNGARMTSSAGGEDDGIGTNGALITVGGIGDSIENPADPFAGSSGFDTDDELYDLRPFVATGDTQILVDTINPSDDDNIFFAYFETSVPTSIADETLFLSPLTADRLLGTEHTVTARVEDAATMTPIAGRNVTFTVTSGPNAGNTFRGATNIAGTVDFVYVGDGGIGTDTVQATMFDTAGNPVDSNTATVTWARSSDCLVYGFEFDDDGSTAFENGRAINAGEEFGEYFTVDGLSGSGLSAAIFDSSAIGPNASSTDQDLLVGQGNLLMLQEIAGQSTPDVYDTPDDDVLGGSLTFQFSSPSTACSIDLVDIDLDSFIDQTARVTLTDTMSRERVFVVPGGWTEDIEIDGGAGFRTLTLDTLAAQPGFMATATASEDAGFDQTAVTTMEIAFASSGAVDNFAFVPDSVPATGPRGITATQAGSVSQAPTRGL
jgi:hypothetical protein